MNHTPNRQPPLGPRAFRLDDPKVSFATPEKLAESTAQVQIAAQPDAFANDAPPSDEQTIEQVQSQNLLSRRGWSLSTLFWSALGGLFSLGIGLWVTNIIDGLFAKASGLGWVAIALAALALIAALAMFLREIFAIRRQKRVALLHIALAKARTEDDTKAAHTLLAELTALYTHRPETAAARAHLASLKGEIIDGRDLIDIAERTLLYPLDALVQKEIAEAAKRVSLVTAIAPRALLDVIFVAAQAIRLIRRIAEIYGGKPGLLGFFRLAKTVGAHLAITGGMAVGDSLLQQVVGHGIASRISAKLGEGVLNGLLTTRVGVSAMSVCRPMPFAAAPAPGIKDVAPFLFSNSVKPDQKNGF